ncbi:hypothetical protein MA16_Dca003057 [Dendrobium catenatum]|uniref:Uncharacterized protein n=1 Tax=Dendrobium catenatum TaxID=906689 RepID=A0A2I0XBL0_9ASPA|nr:hypothetical protein MA16_Dca003057 [Dendrobium catenatum]
MTTNDRRPPAAVGGIEDRRSTGYAIFGGARDVSSSPPTFGDDRSLVFSGLKTASLGNKHLIINEGGKMMKKQLLEVPDKGKGKIIEETMEKTEWPVKILNKMINAMVPRAISENNQMVDGMCNEDNVNLNSMLKESTKINELIHSLADLEEGEIHQTSTYTDLNEEKAVVEVIKDLEKDTSKIELEGVASVSTEKCDAENSGKVDYAVHIKKKRSKQLKEFGPINSSTRNWRLELEGKGTLGSNPNNLF